MFAQFIRVVGLVPLRTKLVLLMTVPLLGMGWFAVNDALERRGDALQAEDLEVLVELSVRTGNLLHETQKERGATAVYLSSGGAKFQVELPAQHALTDDARASFTSFVEANAETLPPQVVRGLAPAVSSIEAIDDLRAEVMGLDAEIGLTIAFYTGMNGELLEAIATIATSGSEAELVQRSTAYLGFLNAKERAGVERAQLSAVFGTDQFAPGQLAAVVSLIAAKNTYLDVFEAIAPADVLAEFEAKEADPVVAEVARLEAIAIDNGDRGFGVDSTVWFDTITQRINLLKEVEDFQADEILATSRQLASDARSELGTAIATAVALMVVTAVFGILTGIGLVGQLRAITETAARIASGDFETDRLDSNGADELGRLARSFNDMTDMLAKAGATASEISEGRINQTVTLPGPFGHAFSGMVASLATMVERLRDSATQLGGAATQLQSTSTTMGQGADRTSNEASCVSASIEQMNSSIQEISSSASEATRVTSEAVDIAHDTSGTIAELEEASGEIGRVVDVINAIAEQTNLLALNATIEAARAGAAGKGFAVVANEVKDLASQTAAATQDISERIASMQQTTTSAVEANLRISETIERINSISVAIAGAVEEQSTTATVIAASMSDVAAAADGTQESAQETGAAAGEMSRMASDLDDLVAAYR